ncbi:MAG: CBS domain-containing protein [Thaumarchaeota archaeon]|nr:MAG: CBS domain-containing protein [Nitrososphaerota archaeon]
MEPKDLLRKRVEGHPILMDLKQALDEPVTKYMSKNVLYLPEASTVVEAAQSMQKNGIAAAIVTKNGKPVGIVTERDILYKVVAGGMDARGEDCGPRGPERNRCRKLEGTGSPPGVVEPERVQMSLLRPGSGERGGSLQAHRPPSHRVGTASGRPEKVVKHLLG